MTVIHLEHVEILLERIKLCGKVYKDIKFGFTPKEHIHFYLRWPLGTHMDSKQWHTQQT